MTPPTVRPLIGDGLEELLAPMQGADSAELEVTIPDAGGGSAVAALRFYARELGLSADPA
jgi:hypothetical protein